MPHPKGGVAIHCNKVLKHLDLLNFSQTERFNLFGHLVYTTLENKHNHLRIRILGEEFVVIAA